MSTAVTKFVYVTYIATTREKIWQALTQPDITRTYWGLANISDWKSGSKWEHVRPDAAGTVAVAGKIIESTPPSRLVLTWAFPAELSDTRKHTRVTFELEAVRDMVRLTVTHDELQEGSEMQQRITNGWPRVLSSLKSYLETGKALDTWVDQNCQ
jgi:uncharacterized protein YndB with AHSA1/START domain